MLFSSALIERTHSRFEERLNALNDRTRRELRSVRLPCDAQFAFEWLIANSPVSDLGAGSALFVSAARHGAALRERERALPEGLFLTYVLHTRVNDEELSDCRPFFYGLVKDRITGLDERAAVLEINRFLAENVSYRSTDDRTRSALAIYASGFGRCGEESVFAVNVLRAAGIPARQIYCPRWSHCDDNHAWVEVYVEGAWHFLGACEIDADLDRGWFIGAASRALFLHTRMFGEPYETPILCEGAVSYLNQTGRYANTRRFTVAVLEEESAAKGAEVEICVFNYAQFYPVVHGLTDADGKVSFELGRGSFLLRVRKGERVAERVFPPETDFVEIHLTEELLGREWTDFSMTAPKESRQNAPLSEETRLRVQTEKAEAESLRKARFEAKEGRLIGLRRLGVGETLIERLLQNQGNFEAIARFLETGDAALKEKLLLLLPEKDLSDLRTEVLHEAIALAEPARLGEECYLRYVVSPRVHNEPLAPCRKSILESLSEEERDSFRENPARLVRFLDERFVSLDGEDDVRLEAPAYALATGIANKATKRVLFVAYCRALGILARMRAGEPEYFSDGEFRPAEGERKGTLVLERGDCRAWTDVSLEIAEDGKFRTLALELSGNETATLSLREGAYRLFTQNRLPNGNIRGSALSVSLRAGERKTVRLRKAQAELSEMALSVRLDEFGVSDRAGRKKFGSELTRGGAIVAWLETGAEPTEHLLNELLAVADEMENMRLCLMLREESELSNRTLAGVLKRLKCAEVYFDATERNQEIIARRLYLEPGKYPLAIVARDLQVIYACGGYSVGSAEQLARFMRYQSANF